jgi:hypothetical protein
MGLELDLESPVLTLEHRFEGCESTLIRRRADLRARLDPGKAGRHFREGQALGKLEIVPRQG